MHASTRRYALYSKHMPCTLCAWQLGRAARVNCMCAERRVGEEAFEARKVAAGGGPSGLRDGAQSDAAGMCTSMSPMPNKNHLALSCVHGDAGARMFLRVSRTCVCVQVHQQRPSQPAPRASLPATPSTHQQTHTPSDWLLQQPSALQSSSLSQPHCQSEMMPHGHNPSLKPCPRTCAPSLTVSGFTHFS